MAVLNFDASTVAPDTGGFEALPAGWYKVLMESSEMKPTKTNAADGSCYLECKYKILDGVHSGKNVSGRLNLRNSNPQAQEIAYKQLSAICHATGVLQVADSAQLHNIPLQIKLKLREARKELNAQGNVIKEYEPSNDITAYKNINEQVGNSAVGGFPAPQAPQAPAFMAPPAAPQFAPPMQQPQFAQAPQFAPPPAAAPAPQAPQWQPPAAQQPWQAPAAAPAAAPQAPQYAPAPVQQAPVQQPQAPQQFAPAPAAPAVNPALAQAATPPWMQPQAPQA